MAVVHELDTERGRNRSARQRAQDDLVMATNSSSIVSKRSVERLYYPHEPHFFRYFVKKFQRRAPLINRGYYLRMHVVDVAVRRFLQRPGERTRVVINLGCGSDVLPWQCMSRYPELCYGVKFVDVDFPDLMARKRTIIQETQELRSTFRGLETSDNGHVMLRSDQYFQIGCDLRHLADIDQALATFLTTADCVFMFVAEVSITYMETEAADSVIKWASTFGQEAEFCLLEQILPDGPDQPFAKTMLDHFEKLKTPLKSVFTYPTLKAQYTRFTQLAWEKVEVQNLWQVWASGEWFPESKRRHLDSIEPFDEWEEFALFANHYCAVLARTMPRPTQPVAPPEVMFQRKLNVPPVFPGIWFSDYPKNAGRRRFGAAMQLRTELGEEIIANALGMGTNNRLRSCDLYGYSHFDEEFAIRLDGPSSRVCHAIADTNHFGSLLMGGRTSPATALRDCWHFSKEVNRWSRTDDLPLPLYRHAATQLGNSRMVLLVGGKTDSTTIFEGCILYRPWTGWQACDLSGVEYQAVFGSTLLCLDHDSHVNGGIRYNGIVCGGIQRGGIGMNTPHIAQQVLRWDLVVPKDGKPTICFSCIQEKIDAQSDRKNTSLGVLINRFGASAFLCSKGVVALVGGIIHDSMLSMDNEILLLSVSGTQFEVTASCSLARFYGAPNSNRPLLVGISCILTDEGQLMIMGGGATCFSMGTYWNNGCYTLRASLKSLRCERELHDPLNANWRLFKTVEVAEPQSSRRLPNTFNTTLEPSITNVSRVNLPTPDTFLDILRASRPVIIAGSDLGACVRTWSCGYLESRVGRDRKVVVHEAQSSNMDFNAKNFKYATKDFGTFVSEIQKGGRFYLRALSNAGLADQPANLQVDFPELADDFKLPDELSFVRENMFSSVLRVSGPVNMWLHYDVMANIYCQVQGSKRLLLFPPSDVNCLGFAPGASSSSVNVFSESSLQASTITHLHEAVLSPGDVLFLPPLWLHTAEPITGVSVAVNVFFRNLGSGYAIGRDVYGNRDLAAYEKGRQDISRIADSFGKLPLDMRDFYIRRLADELARKTKE